MPRKPTLADVTDAASPVAEPASGAHLSSLPAEPLAPPPPRRAEPVATSPSVLANVSLSSVELSRNAKGDTTFCVKVYDQDPAAASAEAARLYDGLSVKYGGAQ